MEEAKENEQIIIKNFDIEAMQKPQFRMQEDKATIQMGSLNWIASSRDLPKFVAFELRKLRPEIKVIEVAFDQLKQILIEKYGDRDKEGKLIQKAPNIFSFTTNAQIFQNYFPGY